MLQIEKNAEVSVGGLGWYAFQSTPKISAGRNFSGIGPLNTLADLTFLNEMCQVVSKFGEI